MPRPYSTDLRERALRACERGRVTRARIAALFGVGETTLYRWQQQTRIDGRRQAKPARGGPAPRLDSKSLDELRALVAEANALTLAEYAERLAERTGVRVSGSTLCRALHRPVGSADIPPGDRAKPDGLVRKKPFEPRSRIGPTSSASGRRGVPNWPRSIPSASSSLTRAGSTPG
jgi:transposase